MLRSRLGHMVEHQCQTTLTSDRPAGLSEPTTTWMIASRAFELRIRHPRQLDDIEPDLTDGTKDASIYQWIRPAAWSPATICPIIAMNALKAFARVSLSVSARVVSGPSRAFERRHATRRSSEDSRQSGPLPGARAEHQVEHALHRMNERQPKTPARSHRRLPLLSKNL